MLLVHTPKARLIYWWPGEHELNPCRHRELRKMSSMLTLFCLEPTGTHHSLVFLTALRTLLLWPSKNEKKLDNYNKFNYFVKCTPV